MSPERDEISHREVRACVAGALDNCGYLDSETIESAVLEVVAVALGMGVSPASLRAMLERGIEASSPPPG